MLSNNGLREVYKLSSIATPVKRRGVHGLGMWLLRWGKWMENVHL